MVNGSKKRILVLITNSFAAINVLHSGVIQKMAEKYEVFLLSTLIKQQEIDQINQYFNIRVHIVNLEIPSENVVLRFFRQLEKWSFFHFFHIETQKIKTSTRRNNFKKLLHPLVFLMNVSGLNRIMLIYIRKMIIYQTSYSRSLKILDHFHFAGVISTSPLDIRENNVVNFLKTRKVSSMAMVISWDNLTSKGIINADHQYILVWNQFMADEYRRFYAIFKSQDRQIRITGIPRFDIYFQSELEKTASNFRLRFKIPPNNKVILFATSAFKHFPDQALIINDLVEYTRRRVNITVMIRCHPADQIDRYRSFISEKSIIIWHPENLPGAADEIFNNWMPPPDFLKTLSITMKNCEVCVQVASTIRLDAAACNKPVISIAYDGPRVLPYSKSVKRFYDYSHQLPLNRVKMDQMVYNKQQLFDSLDKTLNEGCDADYRSLVKPFIHNLEPKSVDSVMQNIHEWLR
ncbi:MAG: CDP-glycerol glycerophosphotransferase family protein [Dyadobacter sp.]|uniref:CDP-glycerol glycerophosphotransferase family protein n=1 Tax=Dyadobacter sp. TaxID=1914288 RepID=UPI003263DEC2